LKNLCIIPARGGSKRIPRKNIKPFLGKPIIAYSIEVALQSGLFEEVMVSTDDEEIAEVAREYGAKVPFMRSLKGSDDYATIADVILEVLRFYKDQNKQPEVVCCLFATAPFLTQDLLQEGMQKVANERYDSAFTVQRFGYPIFRALKKNENGNLEMFWKEHINTRSQDLPQAFHDAGQLYFSKTAVLISEGTFFSKNSVGIELNSHQAIDIDTIEDWEFAEKLFSILKSREN
jgi:N-acylneuraminate cytidylyltransferase